MESIDHRFQVSRLTVTSILMLRRHKDQSAISGKWKWRGKENNKRGKLESTITTYEKEEKSHRTKGPKMGKSRTH